MKTRYQSVDNGYAILDSLETFNRTLYGSHASDDKQHRYFVFAGDSPLFMGALTDWTKHTASHYAKKGVLMSGLALTPGLEMPHFYSKDIDTGARWFHQSQDISTVFRNGWMEYELSQFSPWFPEVTVNISAFPLLPENGFLVHYRIAADQRVVFCAGFGGVTDFFGRFEYVQERKRNFSAADCAGNKVICKDNMALITGPGERNIHIGSSFPAKIDIGDAQYLEDGSPASFLGASVNNDAPVVRMSAEIKAGEPFDGFIVVLYDSDEKTLNDWLKLENPMLLLQERIHHKWAGISVKTPDKELNQTIVPTIVAMDASWHENSFHHGAHGYHSPFLGWRNWYGPTAIGWRDRVRKTIRAHFAQLVREADGQEAVWYDGGDRPDLDHEGTQYHHIRNSTGYLPCLLGGKDIYNMQEVALDMLFHYLEKTGDIELADDLFDDIAAVLDWEARILDPDNDGLYQNFLNTWISDGHSYNGAGCAQSSSYNFRANLLMATIARRLGRPEKAFSQRSNAILSAIQSKLWLKERGVLAEHIDTIGNQLIHPSPELSTLYLAIDCGVLDMFQAYQSLQFTEVELRNERTRVRNGRLVYSSNWYPKKYSTCGIFPAENIHLALAYFQLGQRAQAYELLDSIIEGYFSGRSPGVVSHVLTGSGVEDIGDLDFTDVSSMYLRLVVEGLYGITFHLLDGYIEISPGFPTDWENANLKVRDASLSYWRSGTHENFEFYSGATARRIFRIPLRSKQIEAVFLNGEKVEYSIQAGIGTCYLVVESELAGLLHLQVIHGGDPCPKLRSEDLRVSAGSQVLLEVTHGRITEWRDSAGAFDEMIPCDNKIYAKATQCGLHTLFVLVRSGQYEAWLPANVQIDSKFIPHHPQHTIIEGAYRPLDLTPYFNTSLKMLHQEEYRTPRPAGYSIGVRLNGRYAWEWNHGGHNALLIDDKLLRQANGQFVTPSGVRFAVSQEQLNMAAVSIWDNFPTTMEIPLPIDAMEVALFFIGVTNPMQSHVENMRISIVYRDGSVVSQSLIPPFNFDDWLVPALQTQNESVYFSDFNHGIVQLLHILPEKEPTAVRLEAIANEAILGLLAISVRQPETP